MDEKIPVTKSSMPPYEEYCREIASLWKNCWLTNAGEKHQQLLGQLQEMLRTPCVELFVNGHSALELGIEALELSGEVITTPYTFASTTHALVRNGLKPVFCDIKESDFTIDETKLEALITPDTSAILAVHVYGQPCNVERLEEIARAHGLKLIYDAAHAFGVQVNGRPISAYGDMSMFSFHATKVFHTIEGGALVYRDAVLGDRLRSLRNFGLVGEQVSVPGCNGKLTEFAAAMGLCNMRHLEESIARRKSAYQTYEAGLRDVPGIRPFRYISTESVVQNYAYYPLIVDDKVIVGGRDYLQQALESKQIFTRKYFFPLTSDFICYQDLAPSKSLPVAQYMSDHVLCLPMYADLTKEQVEHICGVIRRAAENS